MTNNGSMSYTEGSEPIKLTDMTGNERIAKFMGFVKKDDSYLHTMPPPKENYVKDSRDFAYDSSWDWLMPVVEKINSVGYDVDIFADAIDGNHECTIHDTGNVYQCIENQKSLIIATYKAVVEFIKWFDSLKADSK